MSQDINYVESIITALQATVSEDNEVDWYLFLNAEKETIINSYCGTYLNVFKGTWKRRFKEVASSLNFRIKNDSGDANNWQTLISDELKAKKKDVFYISKHNNKHITILSVLLIKKSAITYLENLPVEKKWRLKSGRFIEDIVMQAINDSTFEHPCLSYIVDLAHPIWTNYCSPEKTDEVRTYNSVELPDLQDEIQNRINLYDNNTLTVADYYESASDQKLKFIDSFDKKKINYECC
ncbi:hypothetical protein INT48_009900 [Thamnidium elegans]|uniref:Uncharacterized protein n=1 Tax=Thamnidium elegans TaxID=101142 RepID=A0A8H7SIT5_9FUNG|nr:hypothetical protein INT48_009900 [Thamnidium elegans]